MMKNIFSKMTVIGCGLLAIALTACSDANEYEDTNTNNPSWVNNYNDSLTIAHPETLANTTYVRATGAKRDADGRDVQGYVESLEFVSADSVIVKMSEPEYLIGTATWVDDSNTDAVPKYEYTYSVTTGNIEIKKEAKDDRGNLTKTSIIVGVAVSGKQEGITVVHYGDVPIQTYLVKQ